MREISCLAGRLLAFQGAICFMAQLVHWCATSCYQVCSEFLLEIYLNVSTFTALNLLYVILNQNYEIFICHNLCLPHACGRLRSVSQSPIFTNKSP
jgi:hypothetical protein